MSFEGVLAIVLAINLICALLSSFLASRWGHDPFPWALIGGVIGPIGVIALLGSRGRQLPVSAGRAAPSDSQTLIATDGSESSLAAVNHFAASAQRGSAVTLLAVLPVERREAPADELQSDIESHTGEAKRRLERSGFRCDVVTSFGHPATEIIRVAVEGKFRHIVMGRRGHRGVAKLLLGSVSEKVLKEAPIPVTVAD